MCKTSGFASCVALQRLFACMTLLTRRSSKLYLMGYVAMVFLRAAIKASDSPDAQQAALRDTIIFAYWCVGYKVTRLHYFFGKGNALCGCDVVCLYEPAPSCTSNRSLAASRCLHCQTGGTICCQKREPVDFQSAEAMRAYFTGVGDSIAHTAAILRAVGGSRNIPADVHASKGVRLSSRKTGWCHAPRCGTSVPVTYVRRQALVSVLICVRAIIASDD